MGFLSRPSARAVASSLLQICLSTTYLSNTASATSFTSIPQPSLDLSQLGRVGIGGNFDGVSIYQFAQQDQQSFFTNGSQSVLARLPNGQYASIATANGDIRDMCLFTVAGNKVAGIVVGGNFTEMGGVPAMGVALLDPTTGQVVQLTGLTGTVNALLCDQDQETVFVGGSFSGANSTNAIAWVNMAGWSNLPFAGFNGPVTSIAKTSNGSIVFGGQFDSLGNTTLQMTSTNITNSTSYGNFTQGIVNLQTANVSATSTTSTTGFNNPKNIVCTDGSDSAGNVWLLQDNTVGSWTASLGFNIVPARVRINNTHVDGRGTKTFRFISRPNNGIMNLTSIDPASGVRFFCDAWCPLSNSTDVDYQDFEFVNPIRANAFQIEILEWYGKGGGLAGLEVFTNETFVYAVNSLNEPTCRPADILSTSTLQGPWVERGGPPQTDSEYLTANLSGSDMKTAQVTFSGDVKYPGNYTVLVYTPGCIQDNSCATRGSINVTGVFTADQTITISRVFAQTNDYDKYDTLYFGYVESSSPSFKPEISLKAANGQESRGNINIVAQKINFNPISVIMNGNLSTTSTEVVSLNGLFQYAPNTVPSATDYNNSIVNVAGSSLSNSAHFNSIAYKNSTSTVFVGGNMTASNISNIFSIDNNGAKSLPGGGLNGTVTKLFLTSDEKTLYVGGEFTGTIEPSTNGLNHIAIYNVDNNTWSPLGAGVNGRVERIVPFSVNFTSGRQDAFAVSGSFKQILASGSAQAVEVDGFAVWVSSRGDWLQRLDDTPISVTGDLAQTLTLPDGTVMLAGNIQSNQIGTSGAVSIYPNDLQLEPLGIRITSHSSSAATNKKRDLAKVNVQGVVAGAFYTKNNHNITILGGHFSAPGSAGDVHNLAFIDAKDNNKVTGPGINITSDSTVLDLTVAESTLYVGGAIAGTINDTTIGGLMIWDLEAKAPVSAQPPALEGTSMAVYTVTQQPNSKDVYVGGSFDSGGGLACPGICKWVTTSSQWFGVGSGVSGTFYVSEWLDVYNLLVGGDLTINNTKYHMATFNTQSSAWTAFGQSSTSSVPGPVTSFTRIKSTAKELFVSGQTTDGETFVSKWNGSDWTNIAGLESGSVVRHVRVLYLNSGKEHVTNPILDGTRTLLVTGSLYIASRNASAALFDGQNWSPFMLTSGGSGTSQSINTFIAQKQQPFSRESKHLAVGLVVLISLAISLGLIFLLVVIGVLTSPIRKRREGYSPAASKAPMPAYANNDMQEILPPNQLFANVGQERPGGLRL